MFDIPKEALFKPVNAVEAEDGSGKILMYMKNGRDEMLMVDVQEILDTVRKTAPELYMRGVTKSMIIKYT
jgi:hypothetical protein